MAGNFENLDQIAKRDVLLHGDNIGARHHDALDPRLAQPENIFQHRRFFGRKARLRLLLFSEDKLQVGARRCRLPPEQDAHDAREPSVRLFAWLRHHHRQSAAFVLGWFAGLRELGHGGFRH